jgi:hypothetical protein
VGETSFPDLQPGDERAYDALAQVVRETMVEFLAASKVGTDAETLTAISADEPFIQRFKELVERRNAQTEKAIEACCRETAKIMRRCCVGTDLRAMSTSSLAREIRQEVFGPLDEYLRRLTELEKNLELIISKLQEGSTIPSGIMHGWRQGGELGSGDYLEMAKDVPERLIDYACARCFGSQVSFERQDKALEPIHAWIEQELQTPKAQEWKCASCGKVTGIDSLNECADCGKLLCPECANTGCCGHVPARRSMPTEIDEENVEEEEATTGERENEPMAGAPLVRPKFWFWLILSLLALFALLWLLVSMLPPEVVGAAVQ